MKTGTVAAHFGKLLCSASVGAMIVCTPAFAQDTVADPEDEAAQPGDEIVVTGSRIGGVAPVGSAVIALGREALENTSAITVDRIIKEIPQNFDLGVSENSRGQSGGSGNIVYGNSVNLRGIGPYATLVIIDGHRVTSNSRSIDPSVLPSLGVERVEVVADGASAIYGSDAVAGVVNLIPRRNLDGVEAFARYGAADDGLTEGSVGVAIGKVFSRGQIMFAAEHVKRSNLSGDDRDFFVSNQVPFGGLDGRTTRCSPGTIRAGGTTYAIPAAGVTQGSAGTLVAGTRNLCELLRGQDLIPEQRYNSINSTGTFDFNDWLSVFYDGFYSKREFYRRGGYITLNNETVPQTNAFFVRPAGFTGTSYGIDYMAMELPTGDSEGFAESWQITPGIRIQLPHDFKFEALVGRGKTKDLSEAYTAINVANVRAALASSDPAKALDIYGLGRTNPAILPSLADNIFIAPTNGQLWTYAARLNGPLFALPGGEVKTAVGYERQDFNVDLGSARGGPTTPLVFRSFGRKVDSAYAEVYVPVFGSGNAIPGFESLELNAAVRYDKYSDVGSTTNPKFGINWTPVQGIMLRASYGTSFRAPTIPEIYGNSNNLFVQNYSLPTGGSIVGVAVSGQNLDLQPETAKTWSFGGDFEPLDNLRIGLTYWNVNYDNQVLANLSNLGILGNEAFYAGTGVILRGAEAAARVAALNASGIAFVGAAPNPVTLFVDGRGRNLGKSVTRGIDFSVNYRMELSDVDTLSLTSAGTYLTKYIVAVAPSAPTVDQLNTIYNPLKFKMRTSLSYDREAFNARLTWTHVGGYDNTAIKPTQAISSYNPIDLALTWEVPDSTRAGFLKRLALTAEVRNMFNEDPPFVAVTPNANGSGGYDATASDPIGRLFAVSIRTAF
ncbi:TonB-dependent receptor domain-containing protein [Tsuneonella sp. HG222]